MSVMAAVPVGTGGTILVAGRAVMQGQQPVLSKAQVLSVLPAAQLGTQVLAAVVVVARGVQGLMAAPAVAAVA
jgi:predicted transcriptional regulator